MRTIILVFHKHSTAVVHPKVHWSCFTNWCVMFSLAVIREPQFCVRGPFLCLLATGTAAARRFMEIQFFILWWRCFFHFNFSVIRHRATSCLVDRAFEARTPQFSLRWIGLCQRCFNCALCFSSNPVHNGCFVFMSAVRLHWPALDACSFCFDELLTIFLIWECIFFEF